MGALAVLGLAWRLTGWVRAYALERLLDVPNARSSHAAPTPRGGGLAIVLAFALGLVALYLWGVMPGRAGIALLGGALLVAAIGFWDDHAPLPARCRLWVHFAAAAWLLAWLDGGPTMFSLSYPLSLLFIAWMLNLFNFMDGIDGLAAGETVFVAAASGGMLLFGGAWGLGWAAVYLAAAAAGFLAWNWPPAKIFMGDAGSGFVGFALGALAMMSAYAGDLSLPVWLILSGAFWVDATFTLLRRMASGQAWQQAHRCHAYQYAARRHGHKPVTLAYMGVNLAWLLPLALAAWHWPQIQYLLLGLAYAPLIFIAFRCNAGKAEQRGESG
jgi:Fuc2NAc and GlcNAc transferase